MSFAFKNRNITLRLTCFKRDGSLLKFYFVQDQNLETLKSIERFFADNSVNIDLCPGFRCDGDIIPGLLCCFKSLGRRQWCRARVQQAIVGNGKVLVQLIDYGDIEVAQLNNIRPIDEALSQCPPILFEGILADVAPKLGSEWSHDALKFCEQHLLNDTLSGCIIAEYHNIPVIRVAKRGEREPFVQKLIDSGLAKVETIEAEVAVPTNYKHIHLELNTQHTVSVVTVKSPFKFYIHLPSADMELRTLNAHLNMWVSQNGMVPLPATAIGMPCLAQLSSRNSQFYRAVIKYIQHTTCKVKLVDYGYTLSKEFSELKLIPPQFLALPKQAIACSLPDGTKIDTETFSKISKSNQFLTCYILGQTQDFYTVKLLHSNQDLTSPSPPMIIPQQRPKVADPAYTVEVLPLNKNVEVMISYIIDPLEFYCHLTRSMKQLDIIANELTAVESIPYPEVLHLTPGYPVLAKFSEDNIWYRAMVKSYNDTNNIHVTFIDYGNSDKVALLNLRVVPQNLLSIPAMSHRCSLDGLPEIEGATSSTTVELFESLTEDKQLTANVKMQAEEQGNVLVLFQMDSPLESINSILLKQLTKVVGIQPTLSTIETVYVTHVSSSTLFFGQLSKLDQDLLNKLQNDMTLYYNQVHQPVNFQTNVGDLVALKFSDGLFYRATVETLNCGSVSVLYVDFGNREDTAVSCLYPLVPQFATNPYFGIECMLEKNAALTEDMKALLNDHEVQIQLINEASPGKWLVSFTSSYEGNSEVLRLLKNSTLDKRLPLKTNDYGQNGSAKYANSNSMPVDWEDNSMSNSYKVERALTKKMDLPITENNPKNDILYDFEEVNILGGSYKEIFVCHVVSPNKFYGQLIPENAKLQSLMESIDQMYSSPSGKKLNLNKKVEGCCCCALDKSGVWRRGKITNIGEVFFVDYGNTESILDSNIKSLHNDFFALPPQAVCCGLYNTEPEGGSWTQQNIKAFDEMINEKSFIAQFVGTEQGNVHLVNLLSINKLQDNTLNKAFVKSGHGYLKDSNKVLVFNPLVASTSLEFLEPDVQFGKEVSVDVTIAISSVTFFCQLKSSQQALRKLSMDIQKHYAKQKESESVVERPHTGVICVAQYSSDNIWYRARILNVMEDSVKVFYVDYGNNELVSKKKVRYIPQDFIVLPMQSIKCQIKGLRDPIDKLPKAALELFEGDVKCTFVAKSNDAFIVELKSNGKDIANEMVSMKLATFEENVAPAGVTSANDVPLTIKDLNILESFQKDQLVNVIIAYVESPHRIWCQIEDQADQLDHLMAELADHCADENNLHNIPDSNFQIGALCLAKYLSDEGWYRARITKFDNSDQVIVMFIDYGNSEVVPRSLIKEIDSKFCNLTSQAVLCKLHKLPKAIEEASVNQLKQIVSSEKELMAKIEQVEKHQLTISLFDVSNPEVEVNLVESIFGVDKCDDMALFDFPSVDIPTEKHVAYTTNIHDPFNFYVQLSSYESVLEKISEYLSKYHTSEDTSLSEVQYMPGTACCAKFSQDEEWYRARILNAEGEFASVFFVDYGNTETVSKASLRPLESHLLDLPACALPCQLASVAPISEEWSDEAIAKFIEMTQEVGLTMTFLNKTFPALVHIEIGTSIVHTEMIKLGLAKARTEDEVSLKADETVVEELLAYKERTFPSVTEIPAKIIFVESNSKFFVVLEDWNEDLDAVVALLEDSDSLCPIESSIVCGQPCVAKYNEDGAYYRSIVTSFDENNVSITFVDYGNCDVVKRGELKRVSPELMKYPVCAVECTLKGLTTVQGREADVVLALQELSDLATDVNLKVSCFMKKPYDVCLSQECIDSFIAKGIAILPDESIKNIEHPASLKEELNESNKFVATYPQRCLDAQKLQVKVCYVTSWNEFYCTAVEWGEQLDAMMEKISSEYESEGKDSLQLLIPYYHVKKHQACIARYSEDNVWYRAVVTDVDGDSLFVNFIDYGNSEVTNFTALKQIKEDLCALPPFSVKCSFHQAQLVDNSDEVVSRLQQLCDEETIIEVEFYTIPGHSEVHWLKDDQRLFEKLVKDNLLTISKELQVDPQCTSPDSAYQTPNDTVDSVQFSERIHDQESFKENLQIAFVDTSLDLQPLCSIPFRSIDTYDNEIVGAVNHSEVCNEVLMLYVVPSDVETSLNELQDKLQTSYCNEPDQMDFAVREKECYVAQVSDDELWYRVEVLEVQSSVIVRCVDYGDKYVINSHRIRKLKLEFLETPRFSIPCHLSGIRIPLDNESLYKGLLCDHGSEFKLTLCSRSVQSKEVYVKSVLTGDFDFVDTCVTSGYFTQTFPIHYDFEELECTVEAEFVNEDMTFHIFPSQFKDEKTVLQENLQKIYDDLLPTDSLQISSNRVYAVKKGSLWYRSQVINVDADCDTVHVACVDYGTECNVNRTDMVQLNAEHWQLAPYSLNCFLSRIDEAESVNLRPHFLNFMENKKMICQLNTFDCTRNLHIVSLLLDGEDISEILIERNKTSRSIVDEIKTDNLEDDGTEHTEAEIETNIDSCEAFKEVVMELSEQEKDLHDQGIEDKVAFVVGDKMLAYEDAAVTLSVQDENLAYNEIFTTQQPDSTFDFKGDEEETFEAKQSESTSKGQKDFPFEVNSESEQLTAASSDVQEIIEEQYFETYEADYAETSIVTKIDNTEDDYAEIEDFNSSAETVILNSKVEAEVISFVKAETFGKTETNIVQISPEKESELSWCDNPHEKSLSDHQSPYEDAEEQIINVKAEMCKESPEPELLEMVELTSISEEIDTSISKCGETGDVISEKFGTEPSGIQIDENSVNYELVVHNEEESKSSGQKKSKSLQETSAITSLPNMEDVETNQPSVEVVCNTETVISAYDSQEIVTVKLQQESIVATDEVHDVQKQDVSNIQGKADLDNLEKTNLEKIDTSTDSLE